MNANSLLEAPSFGVGRPQFTFALDEYGRVKKKYTKIRRKYNKLCDYLEEKGGRDDL